MPRTAELNYINKKDHIRQQSPSEIHILCKACEVSMSSEIGAWIGGYCPNCYPVVKALSDLYMSDHRKHYKAIQTMAKREAVWELLK